MAKEDLSVNPVPKKPEKKVMPRSTTNIKDLPKDIQQKLNRRVCFVCGKTFESVSGHFVKHDCKWFVGNNNFIPICIECLNESLEEYREKFEVEDAYRRLCMQFDVYFDPKIAIAAEKHAGYRTKFTYYLKKADEKHAGCTYSDTFIEERTQKAAAKLIQQVEDKSETAKYATKKQMDFWGSSFDLDELKYLDKRYNEWIVSYECKNKAQETVFKNICLLDLQIQRALAEGKSADSLYKQMNDWMNSGSLQPKQNNDNTLADSQTFGTLIKKWEDNKPIPEPKEEWKDVDGIKKYMSVWFFGHLCKMLGIKND